MIAQESDKLFGWGLNDKGQLAKGVQQAKQPANVAVGTSWSVISTHEFHSLGIKTDGTLWAWGRNNYGQLGDGTYTEQITPVQIGVDSDWKIVSTGAHHTVAIKKDGTLWAWGFNQSGELGDGTNISKITPVQTSTDTDWLMISVGAYHTVALKNDGTLWAWGDNTAGRLGNGNESSSNTPELIAEGSRWKAVNAGLMNTIAIKEDGTLWAWGANWLGLLGYEGEDSKVPVQIGSDTDWEVVDLGYYNATAIKRDGTLWTWGSKDNGMLADGTTANRYRPTQIGNETSWKKVNAFYSHTLAIKTDGSLWAWGSNDSGQLGNGTLQAETTPVMIGDSKDWKEILTGESHSIALKTDGSLWTWGGNRYGQLGNSVPAKFATPEETISTANWSAVAAGNSHTLALRADGTLWSWGNNSYGQLGDGTLLDRAVPVQIGSDTDWTMVSAGWQQSFAIKKDGTLWTWGDNRYGQLGDGTFTTRVLPVKIGSDADWKTVDAGYSHALAIKKDGTLWSWGSAGSYLGDGEEVGRNYPVKIGQDSDWDKISAGNNHSGAIKTNGSLWMWGSNWYGELGTGDINNIILQPVEISPSVAWKSVSLGMNYTLAIKADGTLWTWGANYFYQLGTGSTQPQYIENPVQLGSDTDWKQVAAGSSHSVGLKNDGSLRAWGKYDTDLIMDPTDFSVPTRLISENTFKMVEAGANHSFAISGDIYTKSPSLEQITAVGLAQGVEINFTLPETARAGTVKITFNRTGGLADAHAPHVLTLDATHEMAQLHNILLAGSKLSGTEHVVEASSSPHDALVEGAVYSVDISYQDKAGNEAAQAVKGGFRYDLNPENDAPVLAAISSQLMNELQPYSFTITATDVDHEATQLRYSLSGSVPDGAGIEPSTGVFNWTPSEEQGPARYTFNITVTDGYLTDVKEIAVEVQEVNVPPTFISQPVTTARAGELYSYQLSATDADLPRNPLYYTALTLPSWLSLDAGTHILSGSPVLSDVKEHQIVLKVSDGILETDQQFTLTVQAPTGIEDGLNASSAIKVFPNPTRGSVLISMNEAPAKAIAASLLSVDGRLILSTTGSMEHINSQLNGFLLTSKAGIYILKLSNEQAVSNIRIVKQ
ncbi:putative Ig domain-containing protein [Cesiribacter sp. SM1]|uniref:RCC1 domain-containing protein n=1 Tax=Cesiribacter sp. SM1 TaxID=2861196 RepID=UPI001CD3245A